MGTLLAIIDTTAIYPVIPNQLGGTTRAPVMINDLAGAPVQSAYQLPFGQL